MRTWGPMSDMGTTLSLLAAVRWAVAGMLFRKSGESVHPFASSFAKNVMGMVMLLLTVLLPGRRFVQIGPAKTAC